jgi:hypothetical protein
MVRRAQEQLAKSMSEKQKNRYFPEKDTYKDLVKRAAGVYDTLPKAFSPGDFVYLDLVATGGLRKGTDQKRGKVYVILEVLTGQKIVRYKLADLAFKPVTGSVYRQNLRKV